MFDQKKLGLNQSKNSSFKLNLAIGLIEINLNFFPICRVPNLKKNRFSDSVGFQIFGFGFGFEFEIQTQSEIFEIQTQSENPFF